MKAITIKNPYASAFIEGRISIEMRSWRTAYRGKLLIVSSTVPVYPFPEYADGYALGEVDLVDVRPLRPEDCAHALFKEEDFEDFADQYAWVFANPRAYENIFPVKGKARIYEVTPPEGWTPRYENGITMLRREASKFERKAVYVDLLRVRCLGNA